MLQIAKREIFESLSQDIFLLFLKNCIIYDDLGSIEYKIYGL